MKVYDVIRDTILAAHPELADAGFDIQPAPENQPGDLGLACFRFAKALKMSPPQAAVVLAGLTYPAPVAETVTAGPYLNFTLDRDVFSGSLVTDILANRGAYGSTGEGAGKKVILEHTSINPSF